VTNAGSSEERRDLVARLRDELAELRASRRRLSESAHAERRAIERELHDGLQQHLVALAMELRRLDALVDRDAVAAGDLLDEITANVREALDEATRLATRIYPSMLEGRGFAGALRSAASDADVMALVDVPAVAGYPAEVTAALYWTWVEALSSAQPGSEAAMNMVEADGGLTFEVAIAGGLPEGHLDRLGDRIEALDGRVSVENLGDGRARVQGWLPLPR
jgi:signal transduction histidine kinase